MIGKITLDYFEHVKTNVFHKAPMAKRDFREETNFNAQEWALMREGADQLGLSKAAFIRFAALQVAEKYMRERHREDTEELSG